MKILGEVFLEGEVRAGLCVLVREGRVAGIVREADAPPAARTLDFHGLWLLPGFIDGHVHSFSTPFEGFRAATAAAAAGGVTTVVDMPFDAPRGIATVADFVAKRERVRPEIHVDMALLAAVKETTLDEIPGLAREGCCGFKMSLFDTDPHRFPIVHDFELLEAFRRIATTGLEAGVHAENDDSVQKGVRRWQAEGRTYPRAHCETRPPVSESEASLRAMEFALATGVRLHVHHVTLARIFEVAQRYRQDGARVTTETCPHYLLLGEEDMDRLKAKAKINPPVRRREAAAKPWSLLARGWVDLVTSDHAPWPPTDKDKPNIFDDASGCPGVQTLGPILFSEGVRKGRTTLARFVQAIAENPARLYNLYPRKGTLLPGADADLAVMDPNGTWVISEGDMKSHATWSPFADMVLQGRVVASVVRGEIVYRDGELTSPPGFGQVLRPTG